MPLDITTLQRSQKHRRMREREERKVAEQIAECAVEARTHRAFVADLPDLAGAADPAVVNLRGALLQRDLERAQASNDALRQIVLDLMELAKHDHALLARARAAYLRAVL